MSTRNNRYTHANPPPNLEAAARKLHELRTSIEAIKHKLQRRSPANFSDQAVFEDWQQRTRRALDIMEAEARFLEEWPAFQVAQLAIRSVSGRADLLAVDVASQIEAVCSRPANVEMARRALADAITIRGAFVDQCDKLVAEGRAANLTRHEIKRVMKPLRPSARAIEAAIASLEAYLSLRGEAVKSGEPLLAPARAISDYVQREVTAFSLEFAQIDDPGDSRLNTETAKLLHQALAALRTRVTSALNVASELWQEHPYVGAPLKRLNQPLAKLQARIERRFRQVGAYIRRKEREALLGVTECLDPALVRSEVTAANIRTRAELRALDIGELSKTHSIGTHVPSDLVDAQRRLVAAHGVKHCIKLALAEFDDMWRGSALSAEGLPWAQQPFTDLMLVVEGELAIVRAYIAECSTPQVNVDASWKSVCAAALARAVCKGFSLTAEERAVLQKLIFELGETP